MALMDELSRYQVLVDLARTLGRAMELHTLLDEILRRSQEVLASEACSIFLPDRETGDLIIHSARGDKAPMLAATRIPKGQGIAGAVFESKSTLNILDAQTDPRFYGKVDVRTGFVTRSMLTVPLLNAQEAMGVLQAINPVGRHHFDKIDEEICEAFSGLIVSALLRLEAEKRQVEEISTRQELELAKEIQRSFLPNQNIQHDACHIYMHYEPAKAVGGDFCLVHPCDDGALLVGLGDVSGKGVPAALTMARATATIKATIPYLRHDLGKWVTDANRQLSEDLRAGRFIALDFLYFDPARKVVEVCAAGQFPPFHFTRGKWTKTSVLKQLPVGIFKGTQYVAQTFPLRRGDSWIAFSDGVSEARNQKGDEWGEDALLSVLPTQATPRKMFDNAITHLQEFVAGAPQHDDITLLQIDWRGLAPSSKFAQLCCPENCAEGREFIEDWCLYAGFDDVTTGQIVLACDEAATNIYRYAYEHKPGPIRFEVAIQNNFLNIVITDEGHPIDPSKLQGRSLQELRPGGLGMFLISAVFEHVQYQPQQQGTVLTLRKKLHDAIV